MLAPAQDPRLYHSSSLLLPDGRVLVGGGGRSHTATKFPTSEIFSPPYLFKGPRPTIGSAPPEPRHDSEVTIGTPDATRIASVALIHLGSQTHSFGGDHRYVPLEIVSRDDTALTVRSPSPGSGPPGVYMLFLVDTAGVPSVAWMMTLASEAPPAGGGGGGGGDSGGSGGGSTSTPPPAAAPPEQAAPTPVAAVKVVRALAVVRIGSGPPGWVATRTRATLSLAVTANQAATTRLSLTASGSKKAIALEPGSRIGATRSTKRRSSFSGAVPAGKVNIRAVVARAALKKGKTYVLTLTSTLTSTSPNGRAALRVSFGAR